MSGPRSTAARQPATGAEVWVGTNKLGVTPLDFDGRIGREVVLRLEGFEEAHLELVPVENDTTHKVVMVKEPPPEPDPEPAPAPPTQPEPKKPEQPIFTER